MELDHSSREKADHQVHVTWNTTTTSSDDQDSAGHTRSYRCSFCQRGFSNAQALGGHMNIHRKDRARLKVFSRDKTNLSLDTMMTTTKNQSPHPPLHAPVQEPSCSSVVDERCSSQKRPNTTSPIETDSVDDTGDIGKEDLLFGVKHELQLSLSIDKSSSSNELRDESYNSRSSVELARKPVKRNMQQQQQLNPGAPQTRSTTELDLELRLGPEPHKKREQQQIN